MSPQPTAAATRAAEEICGYSKPLSTLEEAHVSQVTAIIERETGVGENVKALLLKWKNYTDEGDNLFDAPRCRTKARIAYLHADTAARRAMAILWEQHTKARAFLAGRSNNKD